MLVHNGIKTHEDFFYRVATAADLEEFLQEVIFPQLGFMQDENLVVFDRPQENEAASWKTWKRSAASASLRKLWHLSKEIRPRAQASRQW